MPLEEGWQSSIANICGTNRQCLGLWSMLLWALAVVAAQ